MKILRFYAAYTLMFALLLTGIWAVFIRSGKSAQVINNNITPLRPAVIIDAGHGGQDGGATGVNGSNEKDINLAMALCMRDIFLFGGYDVIMTRTEDTDTDGQDGFHKHDDIVARAAVGQQNPDAIFLGVHMNASGAARDQGFTAFYGRKSERSKALADSISAAVGKSGLTTRLRDVKMSPDTVYIFKTIPNTSVLVEFGFMTNPDDCALLSQPDYRTAFAATVFCGVTCAE